MHTDVYDKCPRSMGFSPCKEVFSRETRADAHANLTFVGHLNTAFAMKLACCRDVTLMLEMTRRT